MKPKDNERSHKWPAFRKKFLKKFPTCANCGGTENLEAHHIQVFHKHPELELVESNLITLCESKKDGVNCHLLVGHLGSFKSWNETVRKDAQKWNIKILKRPK